MVFNTVKSTTISAKANTGKNNITLATTSSTPSKVQNTVYTKLSGKKKKIVIKEEKFIILKITLYHTFTNDHLEGNMSNVFNILDLMKND